MEVIIPTSQNCAHYRGEHVWEVQRPLRNKGLPPVFLCPAQDPVLPHFLLLHWPQVPDVPPRLDGVSPEGPARWKPMQTSTPAPR